MNQHFRKLASVSVVLCAFGCAQPKVEDFGGPVEVTLKSPDRPGAGVPVKIVDEAAVAKALGTLALNQEITNNLPEAVYAEFFDTLTVSSGTGVQKTKSDGRVVVKQLGLPYFVVAQQGNDCGPAVRRKSATTGFRSGPTTWVGNTRWICSSRSRGCCEN